VERKVFVKTYIIAVIPGDGIGADVIAAGIEVLKTLAQHDGGFKLHTASASTGAARITSSTAQ
jgi:tartrate dehydrogenase/decarboxylase/D-malate dehydrogenase